MIDDDPPREYRARGVIVGNVGRLQAGLRLMPAAQPDDGVLDVAVVVPKTLGDWAQLLTHVITRRPGPDRRLVNLRGRRIVVETDRPYPRQVDGDLLEPGARLQADVEPRALVVRRPAG
jgi:diacylglycerol kinase family enzyme